LVIQQNASATNRVVTAEEEVHVVRARHIAGREIKSADAGDLQEAFAKRPQLGTKFCH
jgi:hypothetical protein